MPVYKRNIRVCGEMVTMEYDERDMVKLRRLESVGQELQANVRTMNWCRVELILDTFYREVVEARALKTLPRVCPTPPQIMPHSLFPQLTFGAQRTPYQCDIPQVPGAIAMLRECSDHLPPGPSVEIQQMSPVASSFHGTLLPLSSSVADVVGMLPFSVSIALVKPSKWIA
ncbi:unnamed protein product [Cyprideis torosa]|uniref:Uncharacterized protein n=1 Tax=Cyprideis torosa TaxID=163714 RepID=A0A7R8WQN1_9CRUS|nr:unnamed protein product [Cyprideis torosa]CAG0906212.1 unnamed protein product [Cyprideis torosa]